MKSQVSPKKKFTTKTPGRKFGGLIKTGEKKKQQKKKTKSDTDSNDDSDFNINDVTSEDESEEESSTSDHQRKPTGGKRKAVEQKKQQKKRKLDSDLDDGLNVPTTSTSKSQKKPVKNPGKHKRRKTECPDCGKILAKSGSVLRAHYIAKHKLVPASKRREDIAKATRKVYGKDGKKDKRNRRRQCIYCSMEYSESHLRANHLRPDSIVMCKSIPPEEIEDLDSEEKKKAWTSQAIQRCERSANPKPKFRDVYLGDDYYTVDEILQKWYEDAITFHGDYHVPTEIKEKLRTRQPLDPEERKIHYRPIAVRHQQKRVMHHIFGERQFKLSELHEICNWMRTEEAENAFFSSRLVRFNKDMDKTARLSFSTIATLSRSMLNFLKWVQSENTDLAVKEAAGRAIDSCRKIERTAAKKARHHTRRKGFLEKENYLISLADLQKFTESKEHTDVINNAIRVYKAVQKKDNDESLRRELAKYGRRQVYQFQCHLAVLLTMHTGKRPGVICGIKVSDVDSETGNVTKVESNNDEEPSYQFEVKPTCEYASFKTVEVAYVNVSRHMISLLQTLALLRLNIDKCADEDRLFTSVRQCPLLDIDDELKRAWNEAGLESKFNSTMIRHTIVTKGRDPKNSLTVEELKALARGMDHSVRIAESTYYHDKQLENIDHSKIIIRVLKLNGIRSWKDEISVGLDDDIEKDIMTGEIPEDIVEFDDEVDEEEEEEGDNGKKKKRKVGNMVVIFSDRHTDLIRRLFHDYIADQVANPEKIKGDDIRGI